MILHCPHCGKPVEATLAAVPTIDGDGSRYYRGVRGEPAIERIVAVVCDEWGLTSELFFSRKRPEFIAVPRQAAMWLARELTGRSLQDLAPRLGMKHHATLIHGCKATAARMETDAKFLERVERVMAFLLGEVKMELKNGKVAA